MASATNWNFLEAREMKKKHLLISLAVILAAAILSYAGIQGTHTFTLAEGDAAVKSEQIQPLFGTVKVSGDRDTDVVFTDVETGETYAVGYITSGMTETIQLPGNQWYTVSGGGNITVSPVNVRAQ
jgi:type 1 fimbria pilin